MKKVKGIMIAIKSFVEMPNVDKYYMIKIEKEMLIDHKPEVIMEEKINIISSHKSIIGESNITVLEVNIYEQKDYLKLLFC
jgi:hypothetical protein